MKRTDPLVEAAVELALEGRQKDIQTLAGQFSLSRKALEERFREKMTQAVRGSHQVDPLPGLDRPSEPMVGVKGPTLQQRRVASLLLGPAGAGAAEIYRRFVELGWIPQSKGPAKRGRSLVQPMVGRGWVVQSTEREGPAREFVYRLTAKGREIFTASPQDLGAPPEARVPTQSGLVITKRRRL